MQLNAKTPFLVAHQNPVLHRVRSSTDETACGLRFLIKSLDFFFTVRCGNGVGVYYNDCLRKGLHCDTESSPMSLAKDPQGRSLQNCAPGPF